MRHCLVAAVLLLVVNESLTLSLVSRRKFAAAAFPTAAATIGIRPVSADSSLTKSRNDGYSVQRTEREWQYVLSGPQYNILRQGGTEMPFSSVLESEKREGTFVCAGCGTPLFASAAKFNSGTGWPSFASALPGVEVEKVGAMRFALGGAELRCGTCGGHLGDVFNDGKVYLNTPAFDTGLRHCIDGAALVFKPADGSEDVLGDTPPPKRQEPSFLMPPKITPRAV